MYYSKLIKAAKDAYYDYYHDNADIVSVSVTEKPNRLIIRVSTFRGAPRVDIEKLKPTLEEYNLKVCSKSEKDLVIADEFVFYVDCIEVHNCEVSNVTLTENNKISW